MTEPMKPAEALHQAMLFGYMHYHHRKGWAKPGGVVSRMHGEAREALGRLTSDDLAQMRVEPWELCDEAWSRQQEIRKLLSAFDQRSRVRSY